MDENVLFPTSGAIDEESMIGRDSVVDDLARRLLSGRDALIVEPRQVGKSSVLKAAAQRGRRREAVVAMTDLKIDGVETSTQLGARLIAGASGGGGGGMTAAGTRIKLAAGKAGETLLAPLESIAAAARALGVPEESAAVVTEINRRMRRAGNLPIHLALSVLEADAQLRARPTIVIDAIGSPACAIGWLAAG